MTCATCPHCGFDLERVERLTVGDLEIIGNAEIRWKGQRVQLSLSRTLIVIALARAAGALLSASALAEAVGYEGDEASRLLDVHICHIRKAFKAIDPAFDRIERAQGCHGGGFTRLAV